MIYYVPLCNKHCNGIFEICLLMCATIPGAHMSLLCILFCSGCDILAFSTKLIYLSYSFINYKSDVKFVNK